MSTVRAYYNGTAFVPIEPIDVRKGEVVNLSITTEKAVSPETARKLAAFNRITNNLRELNKTEPLPSEFDEIMSQRMNFAQELDL